MSYDLTKILPHNHPMILLDDVLEVDLDKNYLISEFGIYPEKLFYEDGRGINSLVGIEFMAQTIGCYAYFRNGCKEPKIGFLLGSRLYNNQIEYFKENEKYKVKVSEVFNDNEIAVFDCLIYDKNENEISSATINVYQGDKGLENE